MPARPGESQRVGAGGEAESGHFGQATGHEGGLGVVAITQSVGHAGADGDDVLEGAGEFDADDVVADVGSEGGGAEALLDVAGNLGRAGGDDGGGGLAGGDFAGEVGSGQDGQAVENVLTGPAGDEFADALAGARVEPLDAADDGGVGFDEVADGLPVLTKPPNGDDDENEVGAVQDGCGVVVDVDGVGQGDAGQEAHVFAAGGHVVGFVGIVGPEGTGAVGFGDEHGQGGSPTTGADDGDFVHAGSPWKRRRLV